MHVDDGSNVEIVGCTMKNCVATGFGGAVYAASSSLLVLDSNLESNTANNGGALAVQCFLNEGDPLCSMQVERSTMKSNSASRDVLAGAYAPNGGAIFARR